jgi:hypothetical protein
MSEDGRNASDDERSPRLRPGVGFSDMGTGRTSRSGVLSQLSYLINSGCLPLLMALFNC